MLKVIYLIDWMDLFKLVINFGWMVSVRDLYSNLQGGGAERERERKRETGRLCQYDKGTALLN